jgi:hypothetical protein
MLESSRIFDLRNHTEFQALALEIAQFQLEHCAIYRDFSRLMKVHQVTRFEEIPFLPI